MSRNRVRGLAELPVERVEPSAGNWRTHSAEQRRKMAGLLGQVGSVSELVVWVPDGAARSALRAARGPDGFARWLGAFEGNVRLLDGHMRRALRGKRIGVQITDLDADEAALVLATFDPIGAQSGRDNALLRSLLEGQRGARGVEALLDDLRAMTGQPEALEGPERQDSVGSEPVSESGVTYELGRHRLVCGDARDPLLRVRAMHGLETETLVYDPPWDAGPLLDVAEFGRYRDVLAFADGGRLADVVRLLGSPAWLFTWDCVTSWYTPTRPLKRAKLCAWYGSIERYRPNGAHYGEPAEPKTVSNTRGTYRYEPDRRGKHLSDVFSQPITREHGEGHQHGKPLDWMRMLLGNCTEGVILDPFAGGGVTILAAEQLNRTAVAIESEPREVDRIRLRWSRFAAQRGIEAGAGALEIA